MDKKTGTKEWAEVNINFQRGCEHNCRYCYARYDAVNRFHRCRAEHWPLPMIDNAKVDAPHKKKYKGRVMFPSTHDITETNISQYCCVLRKLLDAGNNVLIVSKPRLSCIELICGAYAGYEDQITFRFTIGSCDDKVLKFWEPGAPNFAERLDCLYHAYGWGFETSVSCEPYLDGYVCQTYDLCKPYISDSFWIGKLRHFNSRVNLDGVTDEQIAKYVEPLKAAQGDNVVRAIHHLLDGKEFIKWKDSIRKVVGKAGGKK